MLSVPLLACGVCVYYSMWHKFPSTASWVVIIPCWFLVLSLIRTWTQKPLTLIPNIYIALPLVLLVFLFSSGMIGPPLGFWIPICCIIGTWTGIRKNSQNQFKTTLLTVTSVTITALIFFGAYDYYKFYQMPEVEKEKFLPVWEIRR